MDSPVKNTSRAFFVHEVMAGVGEFLLLGSCGAS